MIRSTVSVCVCVCFTPVGQLKSMLRRGQVSAFAAKVWHSPRAPPSTSAETHACLCQQTLCVFAWEGKSYGQTRSRNSDKYILTAQTAPCPNLDGQHWRFLRVTSTLLSPQGGMISHLLRSQGGVVFFTASSSEFEKWSYKAVTVATQLEW